MIRYIILDLERQRLNETATVHLTGVFLGEVLDTGEVGIFGPLHILPSGYYWSAAQTIIIVAC